MKKQPTSPPPPRPRDEDAGAKTFLERFPVVGIGASAGGLPAILSLLEHLPARTGMAFVFVQHLSPQHESALPELLGRGTAMPVVEASEGLTLTPDHLYVNPSGVSLTLERGALHLGPPHSSQQGLRLIDDFLASLAEQAPGRAIGVILSGTGSDGTRGLQAVREAGGTTLAQEPTSAHFDGMPRSAIAAGCVDHILPPEGMAEALAQLAHLGTLAPQARAVPDAAVSPALPEEGLQRVFRLLREGVGVDFTHYKPSTIHRRLERRMLLCKVADLDTYVRHLEAHPEELDLLHQDLLIHVTSFFRDAPAFEALQQKVFPELFQGRPPERPFRVWVPGCSTGEEVYSLVMCLMEYLGASATGHSVQVFATDVSATAIEQARTAVYPEASVSGVSPERLLRFFVKTEGGYQIHKSLRNVCVFAQQNLVSDPPFSRVDLISCRNVLIYLGPVLQKKILPVFHYALRPGGFLMLGTSETVGASADLFSLVDKRNKLYRKKNTAPPQSLSFTYRESPAERPSSARRKLEPRGADLDAQHEADRLVLARYGPPGVIVNEDLEILHFRGHTGPYLEPLPGVASLNLIRMAREGLSLELRSALHRAKKDDSRVRKEGLLLSEGARQRKVNLEVHPLRAAHAGKAHCFLVLFEEAQEAAPASEREGHASAPDGREDEHRREAEWLREELLMTQEHLQTVTEEQEATYEELRSTTEELQSSNEELQSTNEELETAKEELQSTNEELTTVNEELQNRNLELGQLNSDLSNLIGSTHIATVMLGNDHRIRRFTPMAEEVLKLSSSDIGRPLRDVKLALPLPDLEAAVTEVTGRLSVIEQEVRDSNGHWYSLRLRPYKSVDNKIEGAVMTLLDIDRLKSSLDESRRSREYARAIVETMREPFLVLDAGLHVINVNPAFYATFQVSEEQTLGHPLYTLGNGQWNIPQLRHLLEEILPLNKHLRDFVMEHDFDTIGHRRMLLNARQLSSGTGDVPYLLLSIEDITRRT
ncbi:chemotaxis protein CheB [Corallococcus aberystwythensis]|uniref:protein-glutamate O-methyltransferase n=1 Tax=Corallococcus aberystwythensis TaxID=2316722 RepID=A0A3A8PLZ8_9BACT|nr:chemotaxis protein CheB [Corallococcus aberystwythensis]RKH57129.1 PAS domain S-box protein [Corallococcus aberystwythensis]